MGEEKPILLGKLDVEKNILAERLKRERTIESLEKLAVGCGKCTQTSQTSSTTAGFWNYDDGEVKIRYEFGILGMGDGEEFDVDFNNQRVFEVRARLSGGSRQPHIRLEEYVFVTLYCPGEWERKVSEKTQGISEGLLREYKTQFPSISL
jgi:hypothetical protein